MLTLPPAVRVFISTRPADLRRSFDGLAILVRDVIRQDPLSGHIFVFRNRRGNRIKVLFWDRSGFVIWYKRLERGYFKLPRTESGSAEINAAELTLILEGIDLAGATRRKRFSLKSTT